jgi:hypothetical protein
MQTAESARRQSDARALFHVGGKGSVGHNGTGEQICYSTPASGMFRVRNSMVASGFGRALPGLSDAIGRRFARKSSLFPNM